METLYKITGPNGECLNGGTGTWSLPHDGLPGEWWRVDGPVEPCRNGLHVTNAANLRTWIGGRDSRVWRVEVGGEIVDGGSKYACEAVRLVQEVTVPDFAAIDETYREQRERVNARQFRAMGKVNAAYPLASGSDYMARVSVRGLPAGHPLRERAAEIAAARAAHDAAAEAVKRRARIALARIDKRHAAALDDAMSGL